jgi:hypothetical protein
VMDQPNCKLGSYRCESCLLHKSHFGAKAGVVYMRNGVFVDEEYKSKFVGCNNKHVGAI